MTFKERKQRVITWVSSFSDEDTLSQFEAIIENEEHTAVERWNSLTPEQQGGLDDAIESLNRGEGVSGEEAWARINSKFKA